MTTPIQKPFTDADRGNTDAWTPAEDEMLLAGLAAQLSWEEIAEDITAELAPRTDNACRLRFDVMRAALRSSLA